MSVAVQILSASPLFDYFLSFTFQGLVILINCKYKSVKPREGVKQYAFKDQKKRTPVG